MTIGSRVHYEPVIINFFNFVIMFWLNENEPMVNFTQYTKWPDWCSDIIRSDMQVTG